MLLYCINAVVMVKFLESDLDQLSVEFNLETPDSSYHSSFS